MHYITRQGGATVTVFVPYDCNNHCPFCINKNEYKDNSKFNLDEIIRSIKIMSVMIPDCDFVFTGGEPLANLESLQEMLQAVQQKDTHHKVFINTSLPADANCDIRHMAEWLNQMWYAGLFTGINVSRHLDKYVQECSDKIFDLLEFQPRINCVLYDLHLADPKIKEKLLNFVDRFQYITGYIQFRKDYVVTTPQNLYDEEHDDILNLLKNTFQYVGSFGRYRMRVGDGFKYFDYKVTYHKTLPYSKIMLDEDTAVLYDIIIKQDGTIKEDWDTCSTITFANRTSDVLANELDLNAYRKVKYEEYK